MRDDALKRKLAKAAFNQQRGLRAAATIVMYSDMADALERMPESMHPDMPSETRDVGAASFRASFAAKSEAERQAWGAEQSNIALGYPGEEGFRPHRLPIDSLGEQR